MTCPCKDCEFRHVGCHAECVHYKEWSDQRRKVKESIVNRSADDYHASSVKKVQKIYNVTPHGFKKKGM